MKRILLVLPLLLLQLTVSFGQVIQTTNGKRGLAGTAGAMQRVKQYTPPNKSNGINRNGTGGNAAGSGEQTYKNDCYPNFIFTVRNYGYSKDGGYYSWGIKVRNNYTKPVQMRYKLIVGNDIPSKYSGTVTGYIRPGETYHNDYGTMMALIVKSTSTQYRIEVSEVCFEGQDCYKNGYVDCNGKQTAGKADKQEGNGENSGQGATDIDQQPEYPGGTTAMYAFTNKNLKYPMEEAESNIQGKVIVTFNVEKDGSITDARVTKSVSPGLDKEALRIVGLLPKFKPGIQNGSAVRTQYNLPVNFVLTE